LNTVSKPVGQVAHEDISIGQGAHSDVVAGDKLRICVNGNPSPCIACAEQVIIGLHVPLLHADKSPKFINLDALTWQIMHDDALECFASIADTNHKPHDCIPVKAGHAFRAGDAIPLNDAGNDLGLFGQTERVHDYYLLA
jgi:hypothetical protein